MSCMVMVKLKCMGQPGIIIRDHLGKVLLSSWKHGLHCGSVEDAEAAAFLEGVQLIIEWIRTSPVIESDCHILVQALNSESYSSASFSNIVKEIKYSLSVILEVKVCKIRRECNRVAHEFAQLAKCCSNSAVWRDHAPTCLHEHYVMIVTLFQFNEMHFFFLNKYSFSLRVHLFQDVRELMAKNSFVRSGMSRRFLFHVFSQVLGFIF